MAEDALDNTQIAGGAQCTHSGCVTQVLYPGIDLGLAPGRFLGRAETVIGHRVTLALDEQERLSRL